MGQLQKLTRLSLRSYLFRRECGPKNILDCAKTSHSVFIYNFSEKKSDSVNAIKLEAMKNIQDYSIILKNQKDNFIKYTSQKGEVWYEKYIKFIGLDKVKRMQDKIQQLEEEFTKAQTHRREIDKILKSKRNDRQKIEQSLHKLDRIKDNDKYIELIRLESEAIRYENQFSQLFEEADQMEREIFTRFCNSIRDSHKEESLRNESIKYFSYILSLSSVVVGAILTMVVNWLRNHELLQGIQQGVDTKMDSVNKNINNMESIFMGMNQRLNKVLNNHELMQGIQQGVNTKIDSINNNVNNIEAKLVSLEQRLSNMLVKKNSNSYWDNVLWVFGLGSKQSENNCISIVSISGQAVKSLFGY